MKRMNMPHRKLERRERVLERTLASIQAIKLEIETSISRSISTLEKEAVQSGGQSNGKDRGKGKGKGKPPEADAALEQLAKRLKAGKKFVSDLMQKIPAGKWPPSTKSLLS